MKSYFPTPVELAILQRRVGQAYYIVNSPSIRKYSETRKLFYIIKSNYNLNF